MARKKFWQGFAAGAGAGAAAGLGSWILLNLLGRRGRSRIVRLEKSVQIGRPVEEVFAAWTNLSGLPRFSSMIEEVSQQGNRSHWRVRINGKTFGWEAEREQFIPNQAVGWKSVRGPKHSGRINFARLGTDTLVHVAMNYAPPARLLRLFVAPVSGDLEGYIEQVLRDFKAALEGKGQETTQYREARATGTFGPEAELPGQTQHGRFGGPTLPVEFTRPPEAKS